MTDFISNIVKISGPLLYLIVGALVFAEDAIFVGFVVPGETAAVLGGVAASRGSASVSGMVAVVILAAIVGDTVGYEVGRQLGPRILDLKLLRKRRRRLDEAQDFLRRRGGLAVFLGRFVAFFRAVMPALAGTSHMRYLKFLAYNAAGGIVWGSAYVILGWVAGDSYKKIESTVGTDVAYAIGGVVVAALIGWRIYKHRAETAGR